jgi:hypothetical protein
MRRARHELLQERLLGDDEARSRCSIMAEPGVMAPFDRSYGDEAGQRPDSPGYLGAFDGKSLRDEFNCDEMIASGLAVEEIGIDA